MKILLKLVHGSHLYGLNTENSDLDFKGIFMPSYEDIILQRVKNSINTTTKNTRMEGVKNTKDDVDTEFYSLHYFIELAKYGETVALDMLYAPDNMILETSEIWKSIVENREKFLTKNLKAFVGYARKQASKYGIKGSRLNDAKLVLDFLATKPGVKLKDIWDSLPIGEHIIKHTEPDKNGILMYEVCNRKFPATCTTEYAYSGVTIFYEEYGKRAQAAALNEGVDWKAVSHAFRAAFQVQEIFKEGKIIFPLRHADFVLKVKTGQYHYQNDGIGKQLDDLISMIEDLAIKSPYPDTVDHKFWDNFLIDTIKKELKIV